MPFDYNDPYSTIECKVLKVTEKAVQIEDAYDTKVWVPRSCVHGGDDRGLSSSIGDNIQLKIRRWFVTKEGLA